MILQNISKQRIIRKSYIFFIIKKTSERNYDESAMSKPISESNGSGTVGVFW